MKKISLILISAATFAVGFTSCGKFLDQIPDDVLTESRIFTSRVNTERVLSNIYQFLPNELTQRFNGGDKNRSGPWTAGSDEAKYTWDFNYANNLNQSVWTRVDGTPRVIYEDLYKAIRNATYFIQNIDGATSEVRPEEKSRWKAEARALRAIFYFHLVRIYGPVILLDENELVEFDVPGPALARARTHFDTCINFIVTQLDMAAPDLLNVIDSRNDQLGRVTIGAAKAYKIQALMLAASPLWNGNTEFANFKNKDGAMLVSTAYDANKWTLAANAAEEFLTTYVPGRYKLFTVTNADPFIAAYLSCRNVMTTDWNDEWIFARSMSGNNAQYDRTPKHVGAPSALQGGGACGVTQTMVDAYFMKNGRPITDPASEYQASGFSSFRAPFDNASRNTYNQWVDREPRFYVGVTYNNSYWLNQNNTNLVTNMEFNGNSGRIQSTSDVTPTGYIVRKNVSVNGDSRGALFIRLAQIYLDAAEALNESSPGNANILTYVNLIRQRAGVPLYGSADLPAPVGQVAVGEAIRMERRVELAFENVRYFDTRRWKIAETTDDGPFYGMNLQGNGTAFYTRTQTETRIFRKDRDYLFPIPNGQVLNNELMVQNPGW